MSGDQVVLALQQLLRVQAGDSTQECPPSAGRGPDALSPRTAPIVRASRLRHRPLSDVQQRIVAGRRIRCWPPAPTGVSQARSSTGDLPSLKPRRSPSNGKTQTSSWDTCVCCTKGAVVLVSPTIILTALLMASPQLVPAHDSDAPTGKQFKANEAIQAQPRWGWSRGEIAITGYDPASPYSVKFDDPAMNDAACYVPIGSTVLECAVYGTQADREYEWRVGYKKRGVEWNSWDFVVVATGRSVFSRTPAPVRVQAVQGGLVFSAPQPDHLSATDDLAFHATAWWTVDSAWGDYEKYKSCEFLVASTSSSCTIDGLEPGKTYRLGYSPDTAGPTSIQLLGWGRPEISLDSPVKVSRGEKKAVVWAQVDYGLSGLRPVATAITAKKNGKVAARGKERLRLSPGRYKVTVRVSYVSLDGPQELVVRKRVRVLSPPAPLRPPGGDPAIGVSAYRSYQLAYLFDPFDEYPVQLGDNAEARRWPRYLALSENVEFSSLRWKTWNSAGAYATGSMSGRKVELVFDSPQRFRCRSTEKYSDTLQVRLYTRFAWRGGLKHVRINSGWMNHLRWYYLEEPDGVYRNGITYEC